MAAKKSYLSGVISSIDSAGEAMQARLADLWVPWSEKTQSGGVYWHAAAAANLRTAIVELALLRDRLVAVDWPDDKVEAAQAEHDAKTALAIEFGPAPVVVPAPPTAPYVPADAPPPPPAKGASTFPPTVSPPSPAEQQAASAPAKEAKK